MRGHDKESVRYYNIKGESLLCQVTQSAENYFSPI